MKEYTVIDWKEWKPEGKIELKREYMDKYIDAVGTMDDKKWWVTLVEANTTTTNSTLPDVGEVDKRNLKVIREQFAQRFFPNLSSKAKRKKKEKPSTYDKIKAEVEAAEAAKKAE